MKELMSKRLITVLFGGLVIVSTLFFNTEKAMAAPEEENVEEEVVVEEPVIIKPTLNASISDRSLSVNAESEKGIKAIFINGYEFENSGNGNLKIKLTQFDAGYEKFYIYAVDTEEVASDIYEIENPYYDKNTKDSVNPADELPTDVLPSEPSSATGEISEHVRSGDREFYQIETRGGRTFYLIVDMLGDEDKVYFLTEISERDLLNATDDTSETLPRNSAIPQDAIPGEGVVTNNNVKETTMETVFGNKEVETPKKNSISFSTGKSSSISTYAIMGGLGVAFFVAVLLIKKKKRRKKDTLDMPEGFEEEEESDTVVVSEKDERKEE